jgi:DNA-binding PucR family transcriptional regulator
MQVTAQTVRPCSDMDWRDAVSDAEDVPELAGDAVVGAIFERLPELVADPDLRRGTEDSTRAVLGTFAALVRDGIPPASVELPPHAEWLARDLARRGIPLAVLLRTYRVGHAALYDWWSGRLRETLEPGALADAMRESSAAMFAAADVLAAKVTEVYEAERDRWVRNADAVRAETVAALLSGEERDLAAAGRRLRYPLEREHVAYVVWSVEPSDVGTLERAAGAVADALGAAARLAVPEGSRRLRCWAGSPAPFDPAEVAALHAAVLGSSQVLVAVGDPGGGLEGFRRSARQALRARTVADLAARRAPAVVHHRAVALAALATSDLEQAQDFVAAELGPLAVADDATRRLAATVRAYLEELGSPARTAERLGVHANTVGNRVRAAEELLGRPVTERAAETLVALTLLRYVEGATKRPR